MSQIDRVSFAFLVVGVFLSFHAFPLKLNVIFNCFFLFLLYVFLICYKKNYSFKFSVPIESITIFFLVIFSVLSAFSITEVINLVVAVLFFIGFSLFVVNLKLVGVFFKVLLFFYFSFFSLNVLVSLLFPSIGVMDYGHGSLGLLGDVAWSGLFSHKNQFGRFIALGYLLVFFFVKRKRKQLYLFSIFFVVHLLTQSLGSLFFLLVACFIQLSFDLIRNNLRKFKLFFVVFLLLGMPLYTFFIFILTESGRVNTLGSRFYFWSVGLDGLLKEPFWGYGYRVFWDKLFENVPEDTNLFLTPNAHNMYLDFALSFGLLPFIFLVCINAYKFLFVYRGSFGLNIYSKCCFLVMVFFYLNGLSESLFLPGSPYLLHFLLFFSYQYIHWCSKQKTNFV